MLKELKSRSACIKVPNKRLLHCSLARHLVSKESSAIMAKSEKSIIDLGVIFSDLPLRFITHFTIEVCDSTILRFHVNILAEMSTGSDKIWPFTRTSFVRERIKEWHGPQRIEERIKTVYTLSFS